ncbi:MAG: glycine cleavage system protein GcvH [Candidatus Omnitrophota bacterium]|nr:glycine cleavage system protein GcvH [Candidatus Omnitrophota bacterium]
MNFPKELRYTKSHEWARREGEKVVCGITEYAQKEISDVVFVEVPKRGQAAEQAKAVAVVESVKAAFDIYAPMSGKVSQVNADLESRPELVNQDCYGQGWFFEIEASDPSEWDKLMTAEEYEKNIQNESVK